MTRVLPVLRAACCPDIVRTALKVSLVVGLVLNLINQGSALLTGGPLDWGRGLLNFFVPYCVSSYSAALNVVRECRRDKQ